MAQLSAWKGLALLSLFLYMLSLGSSIQVAESAAPLSVLAFGEPLAPGPNCVLIAGRVYAPAESMAETLGLNYYWSDQELTVYLNSDRGMPALPRDESWNGYPKISLMLNNRAWDREDPAILLGSIPYLPLRLAEALGLSVGWNSQSRIAYIGSPSKQQLPTIGSLANLEKMLTEGRYANDDYFGELVRGMADQVLAESSSSTKSAAPSAPDFSTTNNQVEGVDEADLVKTDGKYIYQAKGQTVLISLAYPAAEMKLVGSIDFSDQGLSVSELFLDQERLLVLGQKQWGYPVAPQDVAFGRIKPAPGLMSFPPYWQQQTSALVYDISDPAEPELIRTVELAGSYLTARKVDSRVVMLANQHLYDSPIAPHYRDSTKGPEERILPLDCVQYFPERHGSSYLLTAVFDLTEDDQPANIAAYLGAGDNIYMSHSNLYVATHSWHSNESNVYRLQLDGLDLSFAAKGSVPGYLLNQFSMDEWNGSLRVATTYDTDGKSNNGVYILDQEMTIAGQVDGIAPGERIYSARFQNERGYLVTFEQVDPLFVLDLSDPEAPAILGALKIPGFSTYLHPIDDRHLLGIGRDTILIEDKDRQGQVINTRVLERGLKLAIFDVSDLSQPKEKFSLLLGGRGSHSEALYNHKAVLYSASLELLALPLQLTVATADELAYGPTEFQGAIAYRVDTNSGFDELGRVSHLSASEQLKMGYYWPGDEWQIRRLLYVGDHLYAISDGMITANEIDTMQLTSSITLP